MEIVLDELDTGWSGELRISDLARKAGISPAWLQRLFKRDVGVSIIEYVTEKRLSVAAQLLSDSNLTVKEIMFRVGFKDPSNFTRAFRTRFGISPREFRVAGSVTFQE